LLFHNDNYDLMQAIIRSETVLPNLPSASGIEVVDDTAYVVGDDAPYLYQLNANTLAPTGHIQLVSPTEVVAGRLPKPTKPDLECLAHLVWPGQGPGLLLLGSGSLPTRERGWWVPLAAPAAGQPEVLNLSSLYALLRRHLLPGTVLNLEAATVASTGSGPALLLFQRGIGVGATAQVFQLPLEQALAWLRGGRQPVPPVQVRPFALPAIGGKRAGFSGASAFGSRVFVSASVEDTPDPVLDGAVLGSFVGVLDLENAAVDLAPLAWADGRPFAGKVEGVAVRRKLAERHWEVLLVTDDDAGGSTALVAELRQG
jgi:hypothetical protein